MGTDPSSLDLPNNVRSLLNVFDLLLTRYLYSGLSATIGSPEVFNRWLQSVQEGHGHRHKFIQHPHRYSHLRKFTYAIQKPPKVPFSGLDSYISSERVRFLHPVAMLSFGARSLPADLALEASDTLSLFCALSTTKHRLQTDIESLHPNKFFHRHGLLRQKDILRYEAALKDVLTPLIVSNDPNDPDSALASVVRQLEDPLLQGIPKSLLNQIPSRLAFRRNLIHFASDLHVNGDLVSFFAIVASNTM